MLHERPASSAPQPPAPLGLLAAVAFEPLPPGEAAPVGSLQRRQHRFHAVLRGDCGDAAGAVVEVPIGVLDREEERAAPGRAVLEEAAGAEASYAGRRVQPQAVVISR